MPPGKRTAGALSRRVRTFTRLDLYTLWTLQRALRFPRSRDFVKDANQCQTHQCQTLNWNCVPRNRSSPAELVQAIFFYSEVVRNFVNHGHRYFVHDFLLRTADIEKGFAVDGNRIGQ